MKKTTHYFDKQLLKELKKEALNREISVTKLLNLILSERYEMEGEIENGKSND